MTFGTGRKRRPAPACSLVPALALTAPAKRRGIRPSSSMRTRKQVATLKRRPPPGPARMAPAESSCSSLPAGVGPPIIRACAPGDFPAAPHWSARRLPHQVAHVKLIVSQRGLLQGVRTAGFARSTAIGARGGTSWLLAGQPGRPSPRTFGRFPALWFWRWRPAFDRSACALPPRVFSNSRRSAGRPPWIPCVAPPCPWQYGNGEAPSFVACYLGKPLSHHGGMTCL